MDKILCHLAACKIYGNMSLWKEKEALSFSTDANLSILRPAVTAELTECVPECKSETDATQTALATRTKVLRSCLVTSAIILMLFIGGLLAHLLMRDRQSSRFHTLL